MCQFCEKGTSLNQYRDGEWVNNPLLTIDRDKRVIELEYIVDDIDGGFERTIPIQYCPVCGDSLS